MENVPMRLASKYVKRWHHDSGSAFGKVGTCERTPDRWVVPSKGCSEKVPLGTKNPPQRPRLSVSTPH